MPPEGQFDQKCRLPPADTVSTSSPGGHGTRSCLSTPPRRAASGRMQDGHWDEREQGSDPLQEPFDGAERAQVEEDPVFVLLDLRRHFEERHNEG